MPLLAVTANDIDTAGIGLDVDIPVEWLDRELNDVNATSDGAGHLTARLSRSGTDVIVRGHVDVKLSMPCARCLKPAPVDIHSDLSLLLRPKPEPAYGGGRVAAQASSHRGNGAAGEGRGASEKGTRKAADIGSSKGGRPKEPEYEFSSDEADIDTFDGETVVLDGFVREAIVLDLPNFPLCSEACPGIGPVASASLADTGEASDRVDPRLAPLGALREKLRRTTESESPSPSKGTIAKPASRSSTRPLLRSSSAATKTKKKKRNKE